MSKKRSNAALEDAMAEALESVEKRERRSTVVDPPAASVDSDTQVDYKVTPPAEEAEVEVDAAAAELAKKTEELATMKDQMLRLAADFDNFRKRAARDNDEARKFGVERLAREMLNIVDNLDRALEHATKADPVIDGVKMVSKQFLDVLGQFGVRPFSAKDQPFDPERHEAISQQVIPGVAPGTVVSELQRGYMLHERLLRPARVVIAAAPADSDPEAD
jgi:molecular chaperone GrpE